jgi:CDP-6-deoxy-D-xylo-4-hexulose-3-dehydrase
MLAHTLGNPFDIGKVKKFCDKHGLWLVEDNCDALGSKYAGKFTGTHGHIGTSSFYPPHHMTMGEGGAVYTNDPLLKRLIESFRDWGRDCWCPSGKDNTCNNRFTRQYGALPLGYDHKYVYSHFGYNLKATEMQAAVGLAQLDKFPRFVEARKKNWAYLRKALQKYADKLVLPEATPKADPSWFGFLITVKDNAGFTRDQLVAHLEKNKIQTRMLFAGNLIKHPCFDEMRRTGKGFRAVGKMENADRIMNNTFWIGVYPGMNNEIITYALKIFDAFF